MSARDRDDYQHELVTLGRRVGKALAIAEVGRVMRDAGVDVLLMDGPGMVVPVARNADVGAMEPLVKRDRPHHTHPNSPMASHRRRNRR